MKFKEYVKWLYTRWYTYVVALLLLIDRILQGSKPDGLLFFIGQIIGALFFSGLYITIVYSIIKSIKKIKRKIFNRT